MEVPTGVNTIDCKIKQEKGTQVLVQYFLFYFFSPSQPHKTFLPFVVVCCFTYGIFQNTKAAAGKGL